jgi:hypothetical protein
MAIGDVMTAILDRVPVDRITDEARKVHFGRTLLTIIAGILYGIGWLVSKTVLGLWRVVAWCAIAVKVGWMEARENSGRSGDTA